MIFIDFEASSLNGFPIEIGWAEVLRDRRIVAESHYIHFPPWMDQLDLWDHQAEAIHRISRRFLMEMGRPPVEVASRANEALEGAVVCADSAYDAMWAGQLFNAADIELRFSIVDISVAFSGPEIEETAIQNARQVADRQFPMTHRAAEDARHWAEVYKMSLKGGAKPATLRAIDTPIQHQCRE